MILFFLQLTFAVNFAGLPEAGCKYTDPRGELCEVTEAPTEVTVGNGAAATVMVNSLIMSGYSSSSAVKQTAQ